MKTRLLAFALLLCTAFVTKAQYVTIPDANFVAWLNNNGYSQCMNGNQMDTTCNAVVTANSINCPISNISNLEGVQYFDVLATLNCQSNQLTEIHALPATLQSLNCQDNQIVSITGMPMWLVQLNCIHNQISSITLPIGLQALYINENPLGSLDDLHDLTTLSCFMTSLTSLPALPPTLTFIDAHNCMLTSLPTLPNALEWLDCSFNNLTSLPALSSSMFFFDCRGNQIASLPTLPASLESLACARNQITVIPQLPASLRFLSCGHNPITSLPSIPSGLDALAVDNTLISSFPTLPDSMESLYFPENPNIYCLPYVEYVQDLNFINTGITCISHYPSTGQSAPPLNSVPVCSEFNAENCLVYAEITGNVYNDVNGNCVSEPTDAIIGNTKIELRFGGIIQHTYTDIFGHYYFHNTTNGQLEISVDTTGLPFDLICPLSGVTYDTLTITDSLSADNNFALRCKTGFDLAARSLSSAGIFRPANNTTVDIHAGDLANFYNANCAHGVAGTVTVTINGPASYVSPASGASTPSNVAGNVLTYNVADFGTADAQNDFNIVVQTDTFAQAGQQVCFTVSVTPTTGDNDTTNNTRTHCFNIVNSYDPNDKTAYPAGNIDTAQEWLTYTVRFQNTGTAEAQHIYIMDTLESDFDVSTFQLLAYSHQPNVQINESIVRFNFPNINLPDSISDEPGSHGYVQYKVKLDENLPIGTTIENTAFIYFDFNPPVVTNTATNTVAEVQDTTIIGIKPVAKDFAINIYPNPANNQVTVTAAQVGHTIYMYSTQGQLVATQTMSGTAENLNIAGLPNGIYYIEVSGKQGIARKKLVKF